MKLITVNLKALAVAKLAKLDERLQTLAETSTTFRRASLVLVVPAVFATQLIYRSGAFAFYEGREMAYELADKFRTDWPKR